MGLSFRRRSGRISDGSRLIVPGQITTGVKVFPNSFEYKKGSKNENLGPGVEQKVDPIKTPYNPCCLTDLSLPFPGQSIVYNGVTISAIGSGDLSIYYNGVLGSCLSNINQNQPPTIAGGNSNIPNNSWVYTLIFSIPVNNVKLHLYGSNFCTNPLYCNGAIGATCQESFTFTTNNNNLQILTCDSCCYVVNNNQITSAYVNSQQCGTNIPYTNINGPASDGYFEFSSVNNFTTLTISGQSAQYCLGTSIWLCDLNTNPPCIGKCNVFINANKSGLENIPSLVYSYNLTANTIFNINQDITGPLPISSGDIANNTKNLWLFETDPPNRIFEYGITLCPFSAVFNRYIDTTGIYKGLCATTIPNVLLSYSHPYVKRINISGSIANETNLFSLPSNRRLYGDLMYVPATNNSGAKVIFTTVLFPQVGFYPKYYITQYSYPNGPIEMETSLSPQIDLPDGIFERNSKIYVIDFYNGELYSISINPPYQRTYVQTIPLSQLPSFKAGASTDPSCNTVRFQPMTPISSFPGTTAIQQNIACENWSNPSDRTTIFLNPTGLTLEYTTRLYNDPDFTDPIPEGYWVSDGEMVYQVGEDGLVKNIEVCT